MSNRISYLNKILQLKAFGFNVIENVDYEILDDSDISDSNNCNLEYSDSGYINQFQKRR